LYHQEALVPAIKTWGVNLSTPSQSGCQIKGWTRLGRCVWRPG